MCKTTRAGLMVLIFVCFFCFSAKIFAATAGDINHDGRVDLSEAIYALQVSAGAYPSLDPSCLLEGRGSWADATEYIECDVVEYDGVQYACRQTHTSAAGSNAPPASAFWVALTHGGVPTGQRCADNRLVKGFDENGGIVCGNEIHTPMEFRRVFVTSSTHTGDLGGIAGADATCNTRANEEGLGGTYKAWLSTNSSGYSPATSTFFTKSDVPYVLVDGTVIAIDWSDLIDGELYHPINLTETGERIPNREVWTNTTTSGTSFASNFEYHCSAWTDNFGGYNGTTGHTAYSDGEWTRHGYKGCNESRRFYCFEQSDTNLPFPVQAPLSAQLNHINRRLTALEAQPAILGDSSSGSIKLNDFIIQWGEGVSTSDGDQTFNFHQSFPNVCIHVSINRMDAGSRGFLVESYSLSHFTIDRDNSDFDGSHPFTYIAIGY